MSDDTERFGRELRKARNTKSLSLGYVAERLGVSVPYLSDVERGRRGALKEERTVTVCGLLGIDPGPLLLLGAVARGSFRLSAKVSKKGAMVGGMLVAVWNELEEEDFKCLEAILEEIKCTHS